MGFISRIRDQAFLNRKEDEALHALALQEMEAGIRRHGLWAKALTKAGGNESQATAEYIKLVVKDLRDQENIEQRRIQSSSSVVSRPSPSKERPSPSESAPPDAPWGFWDWFWCLGGLSGVVRFFQWLAERA